MNPGTWFSREKVNRLMQRSCTPEASEEEPCVLSDLGGCRPACQGLESSADQCGRAWWGY